MARGIDDEPEPAPLRIFAAGHQEAMLFAMTRTATTHHCNHLGHPPMTVRADRRCNHEVQGVGYVEGRAILRQLSPSASDRP